MKKTYYLKFLLINVLLVFVISCSNGQPSNHVNTGRNSPVNYLEININPSQRHQTIDNFGASDAWSFQFLGQWPEAKKEAIADLLFSADTTTSGQPKGIALSLWRFNLGAGSAAQGVQSGINDEWRRSPSFLTENGAYNWNNQPGQTWFLKAAKARGVDQFLGFFNSPPTLFTKNGKAFSDDGKSNITTSKYPDFSNYIAESIKGIKQSTGVFLDYISPVNEPQWDWKDGGQEGSPYTNDEIFKLASSLSQKLKTENLNTKITLPETAQLDYLIGGVDKPERGNQITAFFNPDSPTYLGNLSNVSRHISAHSYFTTSPYAKASDIRQQVKAKMASENVSYWMSEYCILGDNSGEIKGPGRDLGINSALYIARTIHNDLVNADASSWQWWTAVSAYDYKDGLIYIDKNKTDGNFYQSKMLWALGNFSRFIRPGFERIGVDASLSSKNNSLLASAYQNKMGNNLVLVLVNSDVKPVSVKLNIQNQLNVSFKPYVTSATENLEPKKMVDKGLYTVPPRSVVTLVSSRN